MLSLKIAMSIRTNKHIYHILSEKRIATPDCLVPYLVNVATKEYCSMYLETALISEEICMEILVVFVAAEKK